MDNFGEALVAVNAMKSERIVEEYAIGGAMAVSFWAEPTATFDLDVFVLLRTNGVLTSLEPIYQWSRSRGYSEKAEHIIIAGVPVQIIPAYRLAAEAVRAAAELEYEGHPVRVIRPEYLIAMSLEGSARTQKRLMRVPILLESDAVDRAVLSDLLDRYHLSWPTP